MAGRRAFSGAFSGAFGPLGHSFSGGLGVPQRTLVQQGVVDTLAPLAIAHGGYVLDVVKTGVVVRSYTDEAGIAMLFAEINRTPCIAVATGGASFENIGIGGKENRGDLQVHIYFATQHQRGMQVGRMEADVVALSDRTADPGLHVMMQHTIELLLGQYPNTTTAKIKQLKIRREDELVTMPEITIWMQVWETTTFGHASGTEFRTAPQLLNEIRSRVTTKSDEAMRPAAATVSTSLDVDTDI
jgi:hypothetical protein